MLNFALMMELTVQIENMTKRNRIKLWNEYAQVNDKPRILQSTAENLIVALENDLSLYLSAKCDEKLGVYQSFSIIDKTIKFFDNLDDEDSPYEDSKLASWLLKDDVMNKYRSYFDQSRLELCMQNALSLSGIYSCCKGVMSLTPVLDNEPKFENFQTQQGFLAAWLKWADSEMLPSYQAI